METPRDCSDQRRRFRCLNVANAAAPIMIAMSSYHDQRPRFGCLNVGNTITIAVTKTNFPFRSDQTTKIWVFKCGKFCRNFYLHITVMECSNQRPRFGCLSVANAITIAVTQRQRYGCLNVATSIMILYPNTAVMVAWA